MIGRRSILSYLVAALIAAAFLGGFPPPAMAKKGKRTVGIRFDATALKTTFSYKDVFTDKVRKELKSGLPTRLLIQIAVKKKRGKSVRYWAQSVEIVYDLWEENFSITVKDPHGRRRTRVKTVDEVINLTGILWRVPVAQRSGLKPGSYRLQVLAEVNPVSEEMVRNIQRWLARPSSGHGGSEARTNFFGSFVGRFIDRKIGKADKTVAFVSQWFELR